MLFREWVRKTNDSTNGCKPSAKNPSTCFGFLVAQIVPYLSLVVELLDDGRHGIEQRSAIRVVETHIEINNSLAFWYGALDPYLVHGRAL